MNENDEDSGYLGALLGAGIGAPAFYYATKDSAVPAVERFIRNTIYPSRQDRKAAKAAAHTSVLLKGALKGAFIGNEIGEDRYGTAGGFAGALGGWKLGRELSKKKLYNGPTPRKGVTHRTQYKNKLRAMNERKAAVNAGGLLGALGLGGLGYLAGKYLEPYKDPLGSQE